LQERKTVSRQLFFSGAVAAFNKDAVYPIVSKAELLLALPVRRFDKHQCCTAYHQDLSQLN
jgi:hypothetical protein